jgi:hypothetical protein
MTTSSTQAPTRGSKHLGQLAMIAVFDIAGPLVLYQLLRSNGQSTVSALILSGIFPAVGIAINLVRRRKIDAIGILVLAGIIVGTVLGVLTHNAKLVLMEGSVGTVVFGLGCLFSLWTSRPLIYRFALEFIGENTKLGRQFTANLANPGFRRSFVIMTVVWGVAYLVEAVIRVVVVEVTSISTALTVSKFMPYVVAALLIIWTNRYGQARRRHAAKMGWTGEPVDQQPTADRSAPQSSADDPAHT